MPRKKQPSERALGEGTSRSEGDSTRNRPRNPDPAAQPGAGRATRSRPPPEGSPPRRQAEHEKLHMQLLILGIAGWGWHFAIDKAVSRPARCVMTWQDRPAYAEPYNNRPRAGISCAQHPEGGFRGVGQKGGARPRRLDSTTQFTVALHGGPPLLLRARTPHR